MTVYGRRPSKTTLRIFRGVIEEMKADPLNRKAAEGMKHPPKPEMTATTLVTTH